VNSEKGSQKSRGPRH